MPVPRATGYSRASAPVANEAQNSIFARTSTKKPIEALPTTLQLAPKSSSTATIARKSTDSAKGTMEMLSAQPLICRPQTPSPIVSSQMFESPPKTHTPSGLARSHIFSTGHLQHLILRVGPSCRKIALLNCHRHLCHLTFARKDYPYAQQLFTLASQQSDRIPLKPLKSRILQVLRDRSKWPRNMILRLSIWQRSMSAPPIP